jgi:phage-related protein
MVFCQKRNQRITGATTVLTVLTHETLPNDLNGISEFTSKLAFSRKKLKFRMKQTVFFIQGGSMKNNQLPVFSPFSILFSFSGVIWITLRVYHSWD